MKYKDYVDKYRKILSPLEEAIIILPVLSILLSVVEQMPSCEKKIELQELLEKWKDEINEAEVKDD